IESLSVNNLRDMPFNRMLEELRPLVLEPVPHGTGGDAETLLLLDQQLGKFANLYTYLLNLHAYASNETKRLKLLDDDTGYAVMVRKRDALYNLASGVKRKWEAVSRMITLALGDSDVFDRRDYSRLQDDGNPFAPPPAGYSGINQKFEEEKRKRLR